ncbi:helix-turn-helix domain-containing protein [Methylococcus mesophilus]|uniref:helix-turn-helix domain-containing protein n=1 Tax=Methylococcus mesophilus TaxID=2993564 RepID=UPI00224B4AD5|nr:helix-turn-helix domain-containing protein [Methylococcus mesophilus]UZR29433.1 helix-turn-helix domain-containing protein [Methylococcus mesophilus]
MKTTHDYIEAAKQALNLPSDYAMAKYLGVNKSAASNWKHGKNVIDDYTAVRIADALGIDPLEVIAAANLEREKDAKRQELWRKVYSRCAAAGLMFFSVFSGTYSTEGKACASSLNYHAIYIMRSAVSFAQNPPQRR